MNWFRSFFIMRTKYIGKQWSLWLLLLISLAFSLNPIANYHEEPPTLPRIAVINQDGGVHSQQYLTAIQTLDMVQLVTPRSLENAMKDLAAGKLEGVLVIENTFTERITELDFSDILSIYVSPISSIGMVLSEVFSEKAMELWAEEVLFDDYMDFRTEHDLTTSQEYQETLRTAIQQASGEGELVTVLYHLPSEITLPAETDTPENAAARSTLWYCALATIFVTMSSRWVIDQRRNVLGDRMRAMGIHPAVTILASGLSVVAFCLSAYLLLLIYASMTLALQLLFAMRLLVLVILYFLSVVGILLMISSVLSSGIDLMLLAPMLTTVNAVLGGMFVEMPDWAYNLRMFSLLLPGRMLNRALMDGEIHPVILGAILYFGLGIFISALDSRHTRQKGMPKAPTPPPSGQRTG